MALIAGVAYVALRPLVERRVIAEARSRGIALVIGGLSFDWSNVRIDDARFELDGVRGFRGRVAHVVVGLDGFAPKQIALDSPELVIETDPLSLLSDLRRWKSLHPSSGTGGAGAAMPVAATNAALSWSVPDSNWFDLSVTGATAAYAEPTASIEGARATLKSKSIGPLGLYVDAKRWIVTLGFDVADPRAAPVRIELAPNAAAPSVELTLAHAPGARVLDAVGTPIPDASIAVSGSAELTTGPDWSGEAKGAAAFTLEGFVPPHPIELSPFVFGNTTRVSANLSADAARALLRLDGVKVTAGAFSLAGKGILSRVTDHGALELGLDGDLGCGALADATAKAHLGSILGAWVGSAARQNLQGSVHVSVHVSADTRNLAGARVARSIGIGCGLKPLDPKEMPSLTDLTRKLPEMPPMPDLGPGLLIPNGVELPTKPVGSSEHPTK